MSIIKKTDVEHHLSARHRPEIHREPAIHASATGFPHDEEAEAEPRKNDDVEHDAIVPAKSV